MRVCALRSREMCGTCLIDSALRAGNLHASLSQLVRRAFCAYIARHKNGKERKNNST